MLPDSLITFIFLTPVVIFVLALFADGMPKIRRLLYYAFGAWAVVFGLLLCLGFLKHFVEWASSGEAGEDIQSFLAGLSILAIFILLTWLLTSFDEYELERLWKFVWRSIAALLSTTLAVRYIADAELYVGLFFGLIAAAVAALHTRRQEIIEDERLNDEIEESSTYAESKPVEPIRFSTMGFVDPPTPFDTLATWKEWKRELELGAPSLERSRYLKEANAMIRAKTVSNEK